MVLAQVAERLLMGQDAYGFLTKGKRHWMALSIWPATSLTERRTDGSLARQDSDRRNPRVGR
jgi:hypothetical protein